MTYNQGYTAKQHSVPVKRYCQTLNLKNNPALIAEYRKIHSKKEAWPEIRKRYPLRRNSGNGNIHIRLPSIHDYRNSS